MLFSLLTVHFFPLPVRFGGLGLWNSHAESWLEAAGDVHARGYLHFAAVLLRQMFFFKELKQKNPKQIIIREAALKMFAVIKMLNVHKDAVIFLKRDVTRTHLRWLVCCPGPRWAFYPSVSFS